MKFIDPSDQVLFPVVISVTTETAHLLSEMASEMGISLDELLSAIAEDSAIDLPRALDQFSQVSIPDKCSTADLMNSMDLDS